MAERSWANAFLRTAGLRVAVLPLSAVLTLTSAGLTMHFAGAAAFGLITLVAQLRMALPFADLGLGAAVSRAVAQADSSVEADRAVAELIRRTSRLLGIVGLIGTFAAVLVGYAGFWSWLFSAPEALHGQLDVAMTISLVLFFLTLPLGLAERVLVGQDRADLLVLLGLVPGAITLVYVYAAGVAGVSPMWLALGLPLGMVIFLLLCRRAADYPTAGRTAGGGRATAGPSMTHILRGGLPVLLASVGLVLLEQHGRIVLAATATAEQLSEYALALQLYMPIYSVMHMAAIVFWPRFSVSLDRSLWLRANAALIGLGSAAAVGYLCLARPVSRLISGGELQPSWSLTIAMTVLLVAQSAHLTQVNLLTDRPGYRRQAAMSCSALVCVVPLTLLGVQHGLGATAPAVAMIAVIVVLQVIPGMLVAARRVSPSAPRISDLPADHSTVQDLTRSTPR
ncbi:lipopolysaccharide biosynthesis protein [Nesterenkonia xinjiangensis]|uniref:O-antigen/teichoic acid export membrane protein n=1 Tax=Nesterenkonia xinjiangensis TaxID=225327 RepID=A0A7Z0GM27_9MICC|nr:oligosaccharide flippase family protein [Nesterenkonia xinjiangensis]NYJ78402.1 O-antigen/teichoic acid export membrane protein [Nesterenkonia xinjiangensis]